MWRYWLAIAAMIIVGLILVNTALPAEVGEEEETKPPPNPLPMLTGICRPKGNLPFILRARHGEVRVLEGETGGSAHYRLELWINQDTRSFSLLTTNVRTRMACLYTGTGIKIPDRLFIGRGG